MSAPSWRATARARQRRGIAPTRNLDEYWFARIERVPDGMEGQSGHSGATRIGLALALQICLPQRPDQRKMFADCRSRYGNGLHLSCLNPLLDLCRAMHPDRHQGGLRFLRAELGHVPGVQVRRTRIHQVVIGLPQHHDQLQVLYRSQNR